MCCLHNFDLLLSNNSFNFPSITPQKATATGKHESGTRQHLPAQFDQGHMLEFDPTKQWTQAIVAVDKAITRFIQDEYVSNSEYFEMFKLWEQYRPLQGNGDAELAKMGTD
jgi:hypothetical protein